MSELPILTLVVFTPLIGVVALLLIPGRLHAAIRWVALLASLASFGFSLALLGYDPSGSEFQFTEDLPWIEAFGMRYTLGVDGLSAVLVLLTTLLSAVSIFYSWVPIQTRVKEYYIALLLLMVGMLGVFVSLDLFLFYVFWEVSLIPMYLVIGIWGGPRRIYATVKFVIYTMVGSLLMPVAILLAGVLLKLGGYGFLRFSIPLLPDAAVTFAPIVIGLAVIAILYGALVAMVQPDLKKLVAYSSVSHMGFVMLGAFVFNEQGLQGAAFTMISHGITTGALFLLVGIIYDQTHDRQIAHMGGLNARMPYYAAIFGLFTFASIGLPGLSGFIGEFLVILGAFRYNGFVAAVTMLVVIASAVYMLWMFQRVFFTVPSDWMRRWWPSLRDMSRNEWIALAPLVVLVVALGVYPGPVLELLAAPVERIIDAVNGGGVGLGPLW